jgi:S1-C subfamily serine protease
MRNQRVLFIGLVVILAVVLLGVFAYLRPEDEVAALPRPQVLAPTATPVPFSPANDLEAQVVQMYETTHGAVVNITSRSYTTSAFMQAMPQQGSGSGFFYDDNGHIVTNFHVVENTQELIVTLSDGRNFEGELVGIDPATDLAVIRIEGENLPAPIPLATPNSWRVGQFVVAIGNPFGLQGTMTVGVISSLGRVIESPNGRFIGEAIQTDAAINPGNSGGPLLNLAGEVIGVNSQIISASGSSAGIGFAVPVGMVQRVADQLIAEGRYAHPWLGVQMLDIGPEMAEVLREAGMDVPVDQGVLVVSVVRDSPAADAGIQGGSRGFRVGNVELPIGGDIITAINGTPVATLQDLSVYLENETQVGETVTVQLLRDGESQEVQVTLEERPQ